MTYLPVDAGMIGIIPLAAINRSEADGAWPAGGIVVRVQGGRYLNLHYSAGRITISADLNGSIPVLDDTDFWVGDLCYVLESNFPDDKNKNGKEPIGYWAACERTHETPRYGDCFMKPFRLSDGAAGLVSRTQWGDGSYPADVHVEDGFAVRITVETGDAVEDEEE